MIHLPLTVVFAVAFHRGGTGKLPLGDILGVSPGEAFDVAQAHLRELAKPRKDEIAPDDDIAAFNMRGTAFKSVVCHASSGKVCWISAFVRNPAGISFSEFGDMATAKSTDTLATWEVRTPGHSYRVLVQGDHGRARVVTLMAPGLLARKY